MCLIGQVAGDESIPIESSTHGTSRPENGSNGTAHFRPRFTYMCRPRTSTGGAHPQAGDIHSNVRRRTCPALHAASGSWSPAHIGGEVLAREGGTGGDELGRCALEDDAAAVVAGAGAEVDDPV